MPKLGNKTRNKYDRIIAKWIASCSLVRRDCDLCMDTQICKATYDRIHNALDKLQGKKI